MFTWYRTAKFDQAILNRYKIKAKDLSTNNEVSACTTKLLSSPTYLFITSFLTQSLPGLANLDWRTSPKPLKDFMRYQPAPPRHRILKPQQALVPSTPSQSLPAFFVYRLHPRPLLSNSSPFPLSAPVLAVYRRRK